MKYIVLGVMGGIAFWLVILVLTAIAAWVL